MNTFANIATGKTGLVALCAALLTTVTAAPAQAEGSMTIRNCTQTNARIFFYNNNDVMMAIQKSRIDIDAGNTGKLSVAGTGQSKARVYRRQLLDKPVMIQSNLDHNGTYYLTAARSEWRLSKSRAACNPALLK